MERLRPHAAKYRPRSLRPLRCAVAALAGALLLFPGTAALASGTSTAPPAASVAGALAAVQGQLATLRLQIGDTAARERQLEGIVSAWSDTYTSAQDRVERLALRAGYLRDALTTSPGHRPALPSFVALNARLTVQTRHAEQREATLERSMPPLADMFRAQRLMQRLQAERAQAVTLIAALQSTQRDSALLSLAAAVQGTDAVTYGDWATLLLDDLGAPTCQNNLTAIVAWQAAEFTQAGWNPLATTYAMPGDGAFNPAGVRNFASLSQGLQATVLTLRTGSVSYGYDWIMYRLNQCAAPAVTADAINASMWCHGCSGGSYVTGLVPQVEANYDLYARL